VDSTSAKAAQARMSKLPVDPKLLFIEVKISKGLGRLTPTAQQLFQVLVKNVIRKMQYADDDDKRDCHQTALVMLFANWHNYNTDKYNNPFAYFTEIAKRGLAQGYNELHQKRGLDKGDYRKNISINRANGGLGMHNL
jgi:hypothetical protein